MKAESEHRFDDASELFHQAWAGHGSDYEAAIAAHFLARHQTDLELALEWNQRALEHGLAAPPAAVLTFMPSLYLNLGQAHAMLGQYGNARRSLELGERFLSSLDESPYSEVVRDGYRRAKVRFESAGNV